MEMTLLERYKAGWSALEEALNGVEEDEANAFAVENWPDHEGRVGEDGSIAGLVWHCAAWKAVWADALDGITPRDQSDPKNQRPARDDWEGRKTWLLSVHSRIESGLKQAEVESRPAHILSTGEERPWDTTDILTDEHDAYHAAKIWYLRQRYAALFPS